MTTEEAFIKVLQLHGIEQAFGIIGSAMMPVSDLFPRAGIKFWDCAHETNSGIMCDGYTRATGRMAMAIAQNGPGVTGFVTAMKTAYWNHTPMLLVTPQAANKTIGQGGFQEVPQMALFQDMVCYQEEVRDPSRIRRSAQSRHLARRGAARRPRRSTCPAISGPRSSTSTCRRSSRFERPAGGRNAIAEAARLLSEASFPVILNGAGVVLADAIPDSVALAERLDAPVCSGYQHNDSFPGSHPLAVGPLGYNGSKAAMELIAKADVVLALGTRLNPFSTLPGYGIDYWPKDAPKIIQVDINADRIGLTKPVDRRHLRRRQAGRRADPRRARAAGRREAAAPSARALMHQTKSAWLQQLSRWTTRTTIPALRGTRTCASARRAACRRARPGARSRPRLPREAIISSDIGNNCAIGNAYPTFEQGRKYLAPGLFGPCGYGFPSIVGAKIGCPDTPVVGFAGDGAFGISMNEMTSIGREGWPGDHDGDLPQLSMGRREAQHDRSGTTTISSAPNSTRKSAMPASPKPAASRASRVETTAALSEALRKACEAQMTGVTTFIEVLLNQELGEPFRRDAMKKPVAVAGVRREDMRPQT